VRETPPPPLVRTVEAIAKLFRRALLSVPGDCVGRIPAEFVTPEISFVIQEGKVKVLRAQFPSVIRMREVSGVLTASAAALCFFCVHIAGTKLDRKFS